MLRLEFIYPFYVTLIENLEFYQTRCQREQWCDTTFGALRWTCEFMLHHEVCFKFKTEEDATLFALKWS